MTGCDDVQKAYSTNARHPLYDRNKRSGRGAVMDGISFTVRPALVTLSGVIGMIVQRVLFGSKTDKTNSFKSTSHKDCLRRRTKTNSNTQTFTAELLCLKPIKR